MLSKVKAQRIGQIRTEYSEKQYEVNVGFSKINLNLFDETVAFKISSYSNPEMHMILITVFKSMFIKLFIKNPTSVAKHFR